MLIKLKKVTFNKYKSIQKSQTIEIDSAITTIVGMNESGKTSFLQALAKTNYFTEDKDFKFDTTQDFPRNELADFEDSTEDEEILQCEYEISDELINLLNEEFGKDVFKTKTFSYIYYYKKTQNTVSGISANQKKYIEVKTSNLTFSKETKEILKKYLH